MIQFSWLSQEHATLIIIDIQLTQIEKTLKPLSSLLFFAIEEDYNRYFWTT
jgi:hypothetical protein